MRSNGLKLNSLLIIFLFISQFAYSQKPNDLELGMIAFDEEDWETAYLHFEAWNRQYPKDPEGYWYLGQVFENFDGIESPQLALENYQKALSLDPAMAKAYFSRARLYLKLERYVEAESDLLLFQKMPKGETTHITYKRSSSDSGFSQIFTNQTDISDEIFYLLALAKRGQNALDEALYYLDSAIMKNPNSADYFTEQGNILIQLDQNEKAKKSLNQALAINPEHLLAEQLLISLDLGGDYRQLESLSKAIMNDPENPQLWKLKGYYHFTGENWQEALKDFNKAIELYSDDIESWFYRAKTLAKLKDWEQAEVNFEQVLLEDEGAFEALLGRGQARYYQSKLEGALADFIQLTALDPSDPSAYYHKAITLHRMDRSLEACQDIQKAVELGMMGIQEIKEKICQ